MIGTAPTKSGFSLIEVLVAIAIFSGLLVVVLGITNNTLLIQKRDRGEQALQEELRFTLEVFNREARTAYGNTFHGTETAVTFRNQNGTCVEYFFLTNQLWRAEGTTAQTTDLCEGATYKGNEVALTTPKIKLDDKKSRFTIHPASGTTPLTEQGFITISLQAVAENSTDSAIALQSTVTSRQLTAWQ